MPTRPPRICSVPGCPNPAWGAGRCDQHALPPAPDPRASAHARGYDHEFQTIRAEIFSENPICQNCGRWPAEELHHLVPIADGGDHSRENLIPLCRICHGLTKQGVAHGTPRTQAPAPPA